MSREFVSEIPSNDTRSPTVAEAKVIAANVDFYRLVAAKYDSSERYLFNPRLQRSTEQDLAKIESSFGSVGRTPS